jgi:hypothetical protein
MLWMGLIGAERLDLDGASSGVTVTPFLVLTPVLVVCLLVDRSRREYSIYIGRAAMTFLLLTTVFLVCVGASTFGSLDERTTLMRAVLAFAQVGGTAVVALLVHDEPGAIEALRAGAMLGVWLFLLMNVMAVCSFLGILPQELFLGPAVLRLDSYGYAGIVPRLSGTTIDPNAGGLLLVIFALLAPRVRLLAGAMLLLTLSRSAIIAGAIVALMVAWDHGVGALRVSARVLIFGALLAATLLVAVGRSPQTMEGVTRTLAPFAERIGIGDGGGSASEHGSLVVRAAGEGSRSLQRAAFGLGWGASYMVLQEFFPGNRYGNFHSLYGTAFAEIGVMGLIVVLLLLAGPLLRATPWRPLIAGFIVFNIFYQATTVPAFWLLVALAWMTVQTAPHQQREVRA